MLSVRNVNARKELTSDPTMWGGAGGATGLGAI